MSATRSYFKTIETACYELQAQGFKFTQADGANPWQRGNVCADIRYNTLGYFIRFVTH